MHPNAFETLFVPACEGVALAVAIGTPLLALLRRAGSFFR
jgi:hypothetical protein